MAIDDNTLYGLTGAQIKELPGKIDAVKGLAKVLTTEDYNYPTNNPDGIALWLLPAGCYTWDTSAGIYFHSASGLVTQEDGFAIITEESSSHKVRIILEREDSTLAFVTVNKTNGAQVDSTNFLFKTSVIDNLTSTYTQNPLSANQGKVLNDKIGGDLSNLVTTDKTSLINAINEVAGQGGGGGIIELTSADYNYPTSSPDGVALWLLEPGLYSAANGVKIYESATDSFTAGGTWIVADEGQDTYGIISMRYASNSLYYFRVSPISGTRLSTVKLPDIEQSTGTSTSSVMSQNAVTSMIYADPGTKTRVRIGDSAIAYDNYTVAIGSSAFAQGTGNIAIGYNAFTPSTGVTNSVALGVRAQATRTGEVNIGTGVDATAGFNNSNYRVLGGVYDPQSDHDAATKGYVDPSTDSSAPTTATIGRLGEIRIDTTTDTAYMCVKADTVTPEYTWKQITV